MVLQSALAQQSPASGDTIQEAIFTLQATGASFSKGDVVCLHINTGNFTWDTFTTPAAGDLSSGIFGVCMEDIAQNASGKVLVRGKVNCFTKATAGTVTNGTLMTVRTTKDLEADRATYGLNQHKFVGRALFTGAVGGSRTLRDVMFDGIHGWGGIFGGAG